MNSDNTYRNNENYFQEVEKDESLLENVDFHRFLYVLRKNIIPLILLLITCISSSILYLRYTKEIFQSDSTLKLTLKHEASELGLERTLSKSGRNSSNHLFGEIEFLKSKIIYDRVIAESNISTSYHYYGNILTEERYRNNPFKVLFNENEKVLFDTPLNVEFISNRQFKLGFIKQPGKLYDFGELVDINGFSFTVHLTDFFTNKLIGDKYYFIIHSPLALNRYLDKNLTVDILSQKANTISVSFKDENNHKAQDITQKINEVYLQATIEKKQQVQNQTLMYIDQQLDSTEKKLTTSEKNIEDFIKESETPDPSGEFSRLAIRIDELDGERLELKEKLNLVDEFISNLSDSAEVNKKTSSLDVLENESLSLSIRNLNDKYKSLSILTMHSKPNTLAYKKMLKEVEYISNQVLSQLVEMKKILLKQSILLENELLKYRDKFFGLPSKNTELTRLKRLYGLYEKFYVHLLEKKVEFGISKAGTTSEFEVLHPATLSYSAISPNRATIYSIGILGGLLLSFLLLVVKYLFQNTIINIHDIERLISVPILGSIPKFTSHKMEFSSLVVGDNPKSALVEAIRSIRTNIDFLSFKKSSKIISVTSTVSGEGKTFVAVNLGGVISMSGKKVIVLDLDLRKPKVHLGFGGENNFGMSDLLIENTTLDKCIQHSTLKNLDYISAGSIPPNPAELIMSPIFDNLIETLKETYDVIFIDTPPVGLVTDGMLIMKDADVSLYVVRASYSKRGIEKNIRKLQLSKQYNHLSVILNSVDQKDTYGNYGYGYYEDDQKNNNLISKIKDSIN